MTRHFFRLAPPLAMICIVTGIALVSRGHDGEHAHEHKHSHQSEDVNALLNNKVNIEVRGAYRYITSNGLPDHKPGQFPNRGNPNSISPQRHEYRVPVNPQQASRITPMQRQPFGVALNGIPFDPGTAEFWRRDPRSGWNMEALSGKINLGLDHSNAHVQPTGSYHYHGIPSGLVAILKMRDRVEGMLLVGYAADGFPIYNLMAYQDASDSQSDLVEMSSSYRLKRGTRPGGQSGPGGRYDGTYVQDWEYVQGLGTLDECNGREGVTPEYPDGTYYYVLTDEFPFIPRNFRGTPDSSFDRQGPPPGFGGPGGRPPFPPPGRRPPR